MSRGLAWLALAWACLAAPARAEEPVYLFGAIGKAPVMFRLRADGGKLDGWYLYFAHARQLLISGTRGAEGEFEVTETVDGKPSGRIVGSARGAHWQGTWTKPDGGSPTVFEAEAVAGPPADFSAPVHCQRRRDAESGWTFAPSLALTIGGGKIARFEAGLEATGPQDEQSCGYSLADFTPLPSRVGLRLGSRGDAIPPGEGAQACSIRVVGDADHLYVDFGDSGAPGDDCRSGADQMFCSARGWMAPLIVDRKSGACRAAQ